MAILAAVGARASRAQVSPGPLAEPHRALDTTVGCFNCHGQSKASMKERCLACHKEIAWLVDHDRGYHAGKKDRECRSCHPDHAGRDFELVKFDEGSAEKFDHKTAGFPLDGKHAEKACRDCHQDRYAKSPAAKLSPRKDRGGWIGLERSCASCHDDPHRGALGQDCQRCHDARAWKPAPGFDHAKTSYPLAGKHADVPCAKCHLAGGRTVPLYKPLPHVECSACHADPHAGRLGLACAGCHVATGWVKVDTKGFDHDKTRYPLRGKHVAVPCAGCHDPQKAWGKKPPFATCGACHKDAHAGKATLKGAVVDCAACHSVAGYRPSTYTVEQHAASAYPLEGKHKTVPCASCHVKAPANGISGVRMRPTFARCTDCHKDAHGGQLAARPDRGACEPCHATGGWKPSLYTADKHATLRLPLTGRHRAIECAACHGPGRKGLAPLPPPAKLGTAGVALVLSDTACAACHFDAHAGRFEAKGARPRPGSCEACHGTDAFRPSTVTVALHADLGYALDGAHRAVSCDGCHAESKPAPKRSSLSGLHGVADPLTFAVKSRACDACHANVHGDQFVARADRGACGSCHGEESFRPAGKFDHQHDAGFALDGAHVRVPCAKCHATQTTAGIARVVYRPVAHRCEDCHRKVPKAVSS